jgi:hypothetical protein
MVGGSNPSGRSIKRTGKRYEIGAFREVHDSLAEGDVAVFDQSRRSLVKAFCGPLRLPGGGSPLRSSPRDCRLSEGLLSSSFDARYRRNFE